MSPQRGDTRVRPGLFVGGVLAASALLTGVVVLGAVACSGDQIKQGLSGPDPATPQQLLAELRGDKLRIDRITDGMMDRIEAYNAAASPGQRTIHFGEIFSEDLSGQQRDILDEMLANEKDVSYRALLEKLIADRETVLRLESRILHLEQNLPDSYVLAKQGESQYDLALNYLLEQCHLERSKAERLLAEIDLSDELFPGNKVWFFYNHEKDSFRTYVTRGEANQTPIAIRRALKRRLISERDAALAQASALEKDLGATKERLEAEIASLAGDVETLAQRRWELEEEVSVLSRSEADLRERIVALSSDLAARENSVFFHAASERDLRERGALTAVFKRFRDAKDLRFDRSVDLRTGNTITLNAADYGIERIKKVRILPSLYQADRDYVIERSEDGEAARVVLLDPDLFRGKELLLSVRG